jgi:hypothetical protein
MDWCLEDHLLTVDVEEGAMPKDPDWFGHGTSDNDLYYRMAQNKLYWMPTNQKEAIVKKYNIPKYGSKGYRQAVIAYAKDSLYPILDDSKEYIKRKDWDLDGIMNEYTIVHKHINKINDIILDTWKPKHDICILIRCSNSKPYAENPVFKRLQRIFGDVAEICCYTSCGVIPLEYSYYYPIRYEDFPPDAHYYAMNNVYKTVSTSRLLKFQKKFNFKAIIPCYSDPEAEPIDIFKNLVNNDINGASKWLDSVTTDEFFRRYKAKYMPKFHNAGLLKQRFWNSKMAWEGLMRKIGQYVSKEEMDRVRAKYNKEDEK